jgi:hypothetical protein
MNRPLPDARRALDAVGYLSGFVGEDGQSAEPAGEANPVLPLSRHAY